MDTESLENCLIRFLYFCEEYKNSEKSDLNDLEIAKESLKEELINLLKDY